MLKKNKTAFTLAEVLLTLTIIGIVAAITIPSLMQNIQDMDTVAKLRKTHSTLQGAIKMYMAQSSITDLSMGNFNDSEPLKLWNVLKPYFNISKDCEDSIGNGCFPSGIIYKFLNGEDFVDMDTLNIAKATIIDGSMFALLPSNNCNHYRTMDESSPLYYICATIWIDINGSTPPNTMGLDLFTFYLAKNGIIYPGGSLDDHAYGCSRTGLNNAIDGYAGAGEGCAAKVLKEGKINY